MITPDTTTSPITFTIGTAVLGGQTTSVVNARDLHAALGSQKKFADWIKAQIERCGLIEGLEWSKGDLLAQKGEQEGLLPQKVKQSGFASPEGEEARGGHNKTEYILTIDAAKQVAMSSNTPRGRDVRLYFIECERQLSADQQRQANETADRLAAERVAAEAAQAARAKLEAAKPAPQQITLTQDERLILQSCRDSEAIKAACLRRVTLFGSAFFHEPDWREISNLALSGLSASEIEESTRIDRSQIGRAIKEMVELGILDRKQLRRARTLALRDDPMERLLQRHAVAV
jgi:phage anti-repressor protein